MKKIRTVSRIRLFQVAAAFPDIQFARVGTIWAEVFLTDEEVAAINARFPLSIV